MAEGGNGTRWGGWGKEMQNIYGENIYGDACIAPKKWPVGRAVGPDSPV